MTRCASSVLGGDLDRVEGEVDAFGLAERLDPGVDLADALLAAELGQHVLLAVLALGRDGRVELERPPADIDTRPRALPRRALSSRFWPMKHHGQTTSDTTSTVMEIVFGHPVAPFNLPPATRSAAAIHIAASFPGG